MRPPALRSALLALCLAAAAPARAEEASLTLLHTTDLHATLVAWDHLDDRPAPRGLSRIATLVAAARAEGRPVLLLDNGDALTGSPLAGVWREGDRALPDPVVAAMNRLGYDAMAVGNHEFDLLAPEMERARAASRFAWLSANVRRSADGRPAFSPSLVREVGGVRVGIVGLTTPATPRFLDPRHVAAFVFDAPVEAARAEVSRLRAEERCDVIVLLAHTGLERDAAGAPRGGDAPDENIGHRLAAEVPGVDVLILGHTHEAIPWTRVGATLVTQAGKHGEHLGRVDLALRRGRPDTAWTVTARARLVAVTDSVAADPDLEALLRPYHEAARAALAETLAVATAAIGSPEGRFADGPAWELIQQAQMQAVAADVSLAALPNAAARLGPGPITRRDVWRLYPYDNGVVAVELTGAQIEASLEQSARFLETYTFEHGRPLAAPGWPAWQFDAAEGIAYEVDATRPPGDRVAHLTFRNAPLRPDTVLRVAVNTYRANGGGGFAAIAAAPRVGRSVRDVRAIIEDRLRRAGRVDAAFTRNWRMLPDYAPGPERALVDLLVRRGVAPPHEVLRLDPDEPARRGDLAYWIARAFGWRERRLSGAFADVPDSLEPWLDGLLRRRVLGIEAEASRIRPFAPADPGTALDWAERAARHARYALADPADARAFRRSLTTGVFRSGAGDAPRAALTRAQVLGIVANLRFPTVRVLETTDFHGAILGGASERRTGRAIGGSPVLAAWIERLRAENPEGTVLLDGGDCFQGTMVSNLQFGRPVVEQMNALGYQAMAIGNHEFDWSADTLAARVREMRFAALGANVRERRGARRPPWARDDTLFVRRGVPVGVLGLAYRRTPDVTLRRHVAHLRFEDDSAAAARVAPRLRRAGARIVLGVGHVPARADSNRRALGEDLVRLARGVRGVDAWFGGHSHNQVDDVIDGRPVMIAGALGQFVAVCDLVFDPVAGRIVETRQRLQPTYADEVAPDPAWRARVERWNAGVAAEAAVPLGRNARTLTRNRGGESALGNFVADAMRAAAGADVAFQNSGGLRADLAAGEVTRGDLYEVMPFDNTLVTMELTGAEIRRVLEEGLASGRVAQVSGIRYAFDLGRAPMDRVVELTAADGAPLDPARTYRVACNNFMATGGDNYVTLSAGRHLTDSGEVLRAALERRLAELAARGEALDVRPDGRIRRVGGGEDRDER
uniref:Multifunctional 2',3'-cyclic-nucleotide 2'-phosphodiesterase/5'-nucleotidase/3'-nucleotidase n=1 Tax=Eiseniibacteriota bacterium TaxID=2212470 RepID=A0A832I509_UNCEI